MSRFCLGVDFGGVIIAHGTERQDTFFNRDYLETPPVAGSLEALQKLSNTKFKDAVWIVSKAGSRDTEIKTRNWLASHEFDSRAGITPDRIFFAPKRIGKLAIAQSLRLTHFVDDKLEVLTYLANDVPNLYLFDNDSSEVPTGITAVGSWPVLEQHLQQDS